MSRNRGKKIFLGIGALLVVGLLFGISALAVIFGKLGESGGTCKPAAVAQAHSNKAYALGSGAQAADYFNQFSAAEQAAMKSNAQVIIQVGKSRGLNDRDVAIAIAVSIQEANLQNLNHGDRNSHGLFQQQWDQGWGTIAQTMDPVHASNAFYNALVKQPNRDNRKMIDVAIAVQIPDRNAYFSRWAWDTIATEIVGNTGTAPSSAPLVAAALPVCTNKPSVVADKRAAINDLSKVGQFVLGDDYPFASRPLLVHSPTHYYYRECVDFVSWRLNVQSGITQSPFKFAGYGNAVTWKANMVAQGYVADYTPAIGAVAWFNAHGGDPRTVLAGELGHVAIVSGINADGTVLLEQYNGMPPPNDHRYSVVRAPAQMPGVMYVHVADRK